MATVPAVPVVEGGAAVVEGSLVGGRGAGAELSPAKRAKMLTYTVTIQYSETYTKRQVPEQGKMSWT